MGDKWVNGFIINKIPTHIEGTFIIIHIYLIPFFLVILQIIQTSNLGFVLKFSFGINT